MKIGVYILRCRNSKYYIGSTNNLDRRLSEHDRGHTPATKNILPVKLVFFKSCIDLLEARTLERQLKNKKSRIMIDKIIEDNQIKFAGVA